jgi:hypothetical protein
MNYGRRVLTLGVAMIVISAVLYFAIPTIGYAMLDTGAPTSEVALGMIQMLMQLLGQVLPPLGASLFGAGAVLLQIEHQSTGGDTRSREAVALCRAHDEGVADQEVGKTQTAI